MKLHVCNSCFSVYPKILTLNILQITKLKIWSILTRKFHMYNKQDIKNIYAEKICNIMRFLNI